MGVDREIFSKELPEHPDVLFHPRTIIIGQENELFYERKVPAYVARKVFVFHHKGATVPMSAGAKREDLLICHPKKPGMAA
jgi:hypothetical protein